MHLKNKNISLKRRMSVYSSLILLVTMTVFLILILGTVNSFYNKINKESAERDLQLISNGLNTLVNTTEGYIRILGTDDSLISILSSYQERDKLGMLSERRKVGRIVSNILEPNTYLPGAAILKDGEILYAGYMLTDRSIKKVMREENIVSEKECTIRVPEWKNLCSIQFSDNHSENVIPVVKTIIDKDTGSTEGTVILFLREQSIMNVYQETNQNNIYIIRDKNGTIVSAADKQMLYKDTLVGQKEGYKRFDYHNDQMDWEITCFSNQDPFLIQRQRIIRIILLIFIALILFAVISGFWVSNMVTKPLETLVAYIRSRSKLGNENLVSKTINEITYISDEFNHALNELDEIEQLNYEYQKKRRKAELALLQEQIKPHFLYNTMETVISLIKLNDTKLAISMIREISQFYRICLSQGKEIITIEKEKEIVSHYLNIQSIRYNGKLKYEFNLAPEIVTYLIPKLSLQPIVENAIYHGIKMSSNPGVIIIRGYEKNDKIIIEIFDSGVGMSQEKLEELNNKLKSHQSTSEKEGFGLYNVNERIQLFFGAEYGITIEGELNQFTQVNIMIPKFPQNEKQIILPK